MADVTAHLTVFSAWHWFPQLLIALTLWVVIQAIASILTTIVGRFYRTVMVMARGWPTAPMMDADGDIVYPDAEEEGATQC